MCVCVFLDVFVIQTPSSSSSSPVGPTNPSSGQHITVAKKQQWAQQGSGRDTLPGNSQAPSGGLPGRQHPAPASSGGLTTRQTLDLDQPSSAGPTGRQPLPDDQVPNPVALCSPVSCPHWHLLRVLAKGHVSSPSLLASFPRHLFSLSSTFFSFSASHSLLVSSPCFLY